MTTVSFFHGIVKVSLVLSVQTQSSYHLYKKKSHQSLKCSRITRCGEMSLRKPFDVSKTV
jgi:hypothetical protein